MGGCYRGSAHSVSPADLARDPGWALVRDVPFVPSAQEHDCGVAALAMVFQHWGVAASTTAALSTQGAPGDDGVQAGALRDLARQQGLRAFLIQGEQADLAREIGRDHPVLVGVVQRYTTRAMAHYEVVTGINTRTHEVLTLDPGRGPRQDTWDAFAAEWGGANRLALVVVGPR
ncbi:MAG: peptidase bacteriocin processing [Myxococcales bacterium]|nr:peptidase bacteriocin processing [Myxococcales bacterium]